MTTKLARAIDAFSEWGGADATAIRSLRDLTEQATSPLDGLRVLVVDDDPGIARAVRFWLPECAIEAADCAPDAEALYASRRWDIVLVDVRLGQVNGRTWARKALPRTQRRLYMSAWDDADLVKGDFGRDELRAAVTPA